MHSANIRRGSTFMQVTFALSLLQFGFICVQIIFLKQKVSNLGGPVFLAYSFINFFVIFAILQGSLYQGAIANKTDLYFKQLLMKIMTNIVDTRILAVEKLFFEVDGQTDILRKQKDGTFLSSITGLRHRDLSKAKCINQDVLDSLDQLEEKIVHVIEQLDYKLEVGQLKFFGTDISFEQISGYMSSLMTVLIMLSQEVIAQFQS